MLRRCLLFWLACLAGWNSIAAEPTTNVFRQRGYYVTFMRMPTFGASEWRRAIDQFRDDGANLLLLWMGGAFRSEQFPVTWRYNSDHENVRRDFVRGLIDHAHRRGVKVLLGFTPFAYDGVNQYPLEHPELKALQKNGQPAALGGIHCWGWNLCPSQPESQRFMREYTREMLRFYPRADGLLIESSDYAICFCPRCRGHYFEKEFEFVRAISDDVWARRPDATIAVYPHYFSGRRVPGFEVNAATQPFDPRWTLFFTPHSAQPEPQLIARARDSLWWDDSPSLRGPREIRQGAQRAQAAGCTGYVPSLEAFSFVATQPEEGQPWLVGQREVPLGFGWLKPGDLPYGELPMKVNRIAYREFSRRPELPFEEFSSALGREIFGRAASSELVADLLDVQRVFALERTWCQASPLASPGRVRARRQRGELSADTLSSYRRELEGLRAIEQRCATAKGSGARELQRLCQWVLSQWDGENVNLLAPFSGNP